MPSTLALLRKRPSGIPRANLLAEYRLDEAAGQYAYNRAAAASSLVNLLPDLAHTSLWDTLGLTTTVNAGTDADGGDNALRYVAAGNSYLAANVPVATATYTLSAWVKSNTGSSQTFRMSLDNLNTFGTFTATTAWQRFTWTQALTAGTVDRHVIRSASTPVAMDLLVYGAQLELGASATAFVPGRGDLQLGKTGAAEAGVLDPTWANGGLHLVSGSVGARGRFAAARTLTALTAYAVVRWSDATWANDAPVLGSTYNTGWGLQAAEQRSSAPWPRSRFFSVADITEAYAANLKGDGWHVLGLTYDGINLAVLLDGYTAARFPLASKTITMRDVFLGFWGNNADAFPGDIAHGLIYSAAHTPAQVAATTRALRAKVLPRGITVPTVDRLVVIEGDSISSFESYAAGALRALATPRPLGAISAISGSRVNTNQAGIATVAERVATVAAMYDPARSKNIYSLYIGINDLAADGDSGATLYGEIKAVCQAVKALGFQVMVGTILPTTQLGSNGVLDDRRTAANVLIRNAVSEGWADALFDFAADATMGPLAAASNTSLYSDGIHPTTTAHATYLQPIWSAALATLGIS